MAEIRDRSAGKRPCSRRACALLRLAVEIDWWAEGRGMMVDERHGVGKEGGGTGAVAKGCEAGGGAALLGGEGWAGGEANTNGDLAPLPLAPLPRALVAGALAVPLGVPLEGGCLLPDRLLLPFAGEGVGGLAGAAKGFPR